MSTYSVSELQYHVASCVGTTILGGPAVTKILVTTYQIIQQSKSLLKMKPQIYNFTTVN